MLQLQKKMHAYTSVIPQGAVFGSLLIIYTNVFLVLTKYSNKSTCVNLYFC